MELAIYFENGHVAYFTSVRNFNELNFDVEDPSLGTCIEFEYFGVTSQRWRIAKFKNYAGYSVTTD